MNAYNAEQGITDARDRFLVSLDDATRSLHDASAIAQASVQALAEHLGVDRVFYVDLCAKGEGEIFVDHGSGLPGQERSWRLADHGEELCEKLASHQTVIQSEVQRQSLVEQQIRAFVAVPLPRSPEGGLAALLVAAAVRPRAWSAAEVDLIERVAERCWDSVQRARMNLALTASEARCRAMFEDAGVGMVRFDPSGKISQVNRAFCKIVRSPPRALVGQSCLAITHPEDVADSVRYMNDVMAGHLDSIRFEKRYLVDEESVWVRVTLTRMGAGGELLAVVEDVTGNRATQRAMRESEERLRLILSNVRDHAIFTLDAQGRVTAWGAGAEHVFGWTAEEMLGQTTERLFVPEERERDRPRIERELAIEGRVADNERYHVRKDGSRFFSSGSLEALRDEAGRLRGFVNVVKDITDKKRLSEEREQLLHSERVAREEAERLGRLKDEFLATLSHELRTPLTAILGWAHMLRREDAGLSAEARHGIEAIHRNARAQAQLIDDLLDMNRVVSGKVRLEFGVVDLQEVLGLALDIVRPTAQAKGVHLEIEKGSGSAPVLGDASRLQQILWNLLSNAIKFTPTGGRVTAGVTVSRHEVLACVADTGQGIAQNFLPHVFERFRQADASTTRRHGGLGLGLSIVRHLVELHGGRVWAESEGEGKGATFTVAFPALVAWEDVLTESSLHELTLSSEQTPHLQGVTALVVEDEPDARSLLEQLLASCEAKVVVAGSAAEALQRLQEQVPDILVSDICMPQMDGYDLIRRVRALPPERGGSIPAIALTAFARSEDREQALAAGYQVHLAKPVEPRELVRAIYGLVDESITDSHG